MFLWFCCQITLLSGVFFSEKQKCRCALDLGENIVISFEELKTISTAKKGEDIAILD